MRKLLLIAGLLITFSCIDEPCADVYDPVCTPDGTQYGNDCEARNAGVKEYTSCISWLTNGHNCVPTSIPLNPMVDKGLAVVTLPTFVKG